MPTLLVEMRDPGDVDAHLRALERNGARPLPGFRPVPYAGVGGKPSTVVLTVEVSDPGAAERIRSLAGVVQVYGDPEIAGFGPE